MRTFSGLLLDPYDDPQRALLHAAYPDPAYLPGHIKMARDLSGKLADLPDALFALCMRNDGESLRKFAMVDPGNTLLSTLYFLKTGSILPDVAQQRAAENLVKAAGWYGLPVHESLHKIAFLGALMKGVGALGGAASKVAPVVAKGVGSLGASIVKDPMAAAGKAMGAMGTLGSVKAIGDNMNSAAHAGGAIQPLSAFGG